MTTFNDFCTVHHAVIEKTRAQTEIIYVTTDFELAYKLVGVNPNSREIHSKIVYHPDVKTTGVVFDMDSDDPDQIA